MTEILRKNLSGEVYDVLKGMILSGELKPGKKLQEEELAMRLGVSRTPLRQAISALAQDNFVEIWPRKGAFVFILSKQDIIEIYDVRMVLEGLAARLAAPEIPAEDLEMMTDILKKAEAVMEDYPEQAINADVLLHELVVKNCGNARLEKIAAGLRDQVHLFRVREGHQPEVVREVMKERWNILNALKEHDGDKAEELIIRHIQGVKERRLAQFSDEY